MATGDLKNNITKLESDLKSVKFPQALPIYSVSNGDPASFLPLLHHVLLDFSPLLLKYFANRSYDFYGKKDSRFIETVYSALRDEFSYKPKITKEQFFAKGFAERKCIFITDVIRLCKGLHQDLARKAKTSISPSIVFKKPLNTKIRAQSKRVIANHSIKLSHSSPTRIAVFQKSEQSPSKSPSYPPSKHMSGTYWNEEATKLSQRPLSPPVPAQKPIAGDSIVYHQDDSLLYYNQSNFSEGSHSMTSATGGHFYEEYSIVDAGKPIEITDYYQESLISGKPQTRTYEIPDDNLKSVCSGHRTPSPKRETDHSTFSAALEIKALDLDAVVEKIKPSPKSLRATTPIGATPVSISHETDAFRSDLEIVKKQLLDSQSDKEKMAMDLLHIKNRVYALEVRLEEGRRQPQSDQNKENIKNASATEKALKDDTSLQNPIDRIKSIQQKLSQAKRTLII